MHALTRREYDAATLLKEHPPKLGHRNKRLALELACPLGAVHGGRIGYSRWEALALPESMQLHPTALSVRPDVYDYAGGDTAVWHVNFADPQLFIAYGSPLLAQDELQVLEHPALGSLREALLAEGLPALTEERGAPTPVLVTGVERRCALDTSADPSAGRPRGLYGNQFAKASEAVVRSALRVLTPPTRTNLIAMAAPTGSRGRYTLATIEAILRTASTAFRAAVEESRRLWPGAPVEVRTGFWGCGAFGGNRVLMTLLQLLAARLAGVDRVVFHAFNVAGVLDYEEGAAVLERVLRRGAPGEPLRALLQRVEALGLQWGTSDGN
jgi:hypothetical protein